MFNNLFYIYSNDNGIINRYINENLNNFEIKKLKYELIKKDNELKILQKRYNKLLNNNIKTELDNKTKHKDNNITIDSIKQIEPYIKYNTNISNTNSKDVISDVDNSSDEYEKVDNI
jgi:hypothetical protein